MINIGTIVRIKNDEAALVVGASGSQIYVPDSENLNDAQFFLFAVCVALDGEHDVLTDAVQTIVDYVADEVVEA